MDRKNQLLELLRRRNLKATSARLEFLSVLSDFNRAIPFSEIQHALHDFDRVTLYRTLQTFMDKGIIHKAIIEENETFFAMCSNTCTSETHNHKHIHFKCTNCDSVTCVQADDPISLSVEGHFIENFEIEATGVCSSCN